MAAEWPRCQSAVQWQARKRVLQQEWMPSRQGVHVLAVATASTLPA
jgi:hypothetical protein